MLLPQPIVVRLDFDIYTSQVKCELRRRKIYRDICLGFITRQERLESVRDIFVSSIGRELFSLLPRKSCHGSDVSAARIGPEPARVSQQVKERKSRK